MYHLYNSPSTFVLLLFSHVKYRFCLSKQQMHIVHRRRNRSQEDISKDAIGMSVVGVFFELGNSPNHHLTPITDALKEVERAGSTWALSDKKNIFNQTFVHPSIHPSHWGFVHACGWCQLQSKHTRLLKAPPISDPFIMLFPPLTTTRNVTLKDFTLKSILPRIPDYFRYNGSLTTPPCDIVVQWSAWCGSRSVCPASRFVNWDWLAVSWMFIESSCSHNKIFVA